MHEIKINGKKVWCCQIDGKEYRLATEYKRSYWVSRDGCVLCGRSLRPAKLTYNRGGYAHVGGVFVHRLVASVWIAGWFEGAEVNHIDYNRTNNTAENLEWVSHHDNQIHSAENMSAGKSKYGIVFTMAIVLTVKQMLLDGVSVPEIVSELYPELQGHQRKCMLDRIRDIKRGKNWKHVELGGVDDYDNT